MPAVWLLDVDGVVNVTRPGWGGPPRRGLARALGREFRIGWAPKLVAEIAGLHASGAVEVRWASSWNDNIGEIERVLGLGGLPLAFAPLGAGLSVPAVTAAKLAAALAVVGEGHRLIWTDDEAIPADGLDAERLRASGALLIAPKARRGLQPEDIASIKAFLVADQEATR